MGAVAPATPNIHARARTHDTGVAAGRIAQNASAVCPVCEAGPSLTPIHPRPPNNTDGVSLDCGDCTPLYGHLPTPPNRNEYAVWRPCPARQSQSLAGAKQRTRGRSSPLPAVEVACLTDTTSSSCRSSACSCAVPRDRTESRWPVDRPRARGFPPCGWRPRRPGPAFVATEVNCLAWPRTCGPWRDARCPMLEIPSIRWSRIGGASSPYVPSVRAWVWRSVFRCSIPSPSGCPGPRVGGLGG